MTSLDSSQQHQLSENDDWPARASASIVDYVGQVRDKTTGPALVASRTAVYAVAIAMIAFVILIVLLLGLFRLLVVGSGYLPFVEPDESWVAHYVLGGIFLLAGIFLWHKRDQ